MKNNSVPPNLIGFGFPFPVPLFSYETEYCNCPWPEAKCSAQMSPDPKYYPRDITYKHMIHIFLFFVKALLSVVSNVWICHLTEKAEDRVNFFFFLLSDGTSFCRMFSQPDSAMPELF